MNPHWKIFLASQGINFESEKSVFTPAPHKKSIYPVSHLAVLTVSGTDAAKFLQGQVTCNVNEISPTQGSFGAFCNAKGRAITTFVLIKSGEDFLMLLPAELLETVRKKLQMYVMRSSVQLIDSAETLCLIGLDCAESQNPVLLTRQSEDIVTVSFKDRELLITSPESAMALWSQRTAEGFQPRTDKDWQYAEILSGIPWLTLETSESYIPQMLNMDKLGGISLNKGCYVGQEVVARTHYLGKAKRALFLAECNLDLTPEINAVLIDDSSGTELEAGKILSSQGNKMLIVLHVNDSNVYQLKLKDHPESQLTLLPITTP